jgi:hypothetical protein
MKRILLIVAAGLALFFTLSAESCSEPSARDQAVAKQANLATVAINSTPIPNINYFPERRTIAKWAEAWDKPSIPTYVYLISFGKVIGYYVCNGKPASTRSYLTPEENVASYYSGNPVVDAPDIDGTYGDNNPGIRFFTSSGVAVEWAGDGASYIYSNAILPLDVPLLGR